MGAARTKTTSERCADIKPVAVALIKRRAAAGNVMALEDERPKVSVCEGHGGSQAGDTSADHNRVQTLGDTL